MPVQTAPRPAMSAHASLRKGASLAFCIATLGLLGACAGQPTISAQQESSQYRSRAGRNYTPPGPPSDPWGPYIREAAAKFDVPDRWVREVMRQESGGRQYGRSGDLVTSGAGAMGLMQVMPATYDEIRGRYPELGNDPYDPHNNILAGTAYIREMYDIYGSPGFLAAYNAGPGRLDDYLTRNRTLPEETRRYVAAIGPRLAGAEPRTPSPGQQYAMNAVPFTIPDGPRYTASARYSAPAAETVVAAATPIRLNPQPSAPIQLAAPMQLAAPIQLAALPEPTRAPIVLRPQPIEVAQLPEPPPPVYTPASVYTPIQVAQLPEPPRYTPPTREPAYRDAPRSQQQLASAALVPVAPRGGGFPFITSAHAEPIGIHRGGSTPGNWAVQVGAFANEGLAASATTSARDHAREVLGTARSSVTAVRQPHGLLFRARLTGLSRDSAAQACERLARARTNCMVVSPDAQS